jgi:hypothetical protein
VKRNVRIPLPPPATARCAVLGTLAQTAGDSPVALRPVTRYTASGAATEAHQEIEVPAPAERMRLMRERRRRRGLRELRLVVPDPRLQSVRRRVAAQVARLARSSEDEAMRWTEAVSEFDAPDRQVGDATR